MAWIGIIVAAVIDFFNASDKMGKGVDLAADISWAVMNLLIAAYAFLYYRSRWGGSVCSVSVVLAFFAEYSMGVGMFIGKTATGLNLGVTVMHLFLQFKFYSRELDGEVVVEL
ncbi:MAG: hypothetical protein ACKVJG_25235 [Candidatus Latescibacterota bacterium]|jgi:hypothetical protein